MKSSPDSVSWLAPEAGPGRVAVAISPSGAPVEKKNEGSEACDTTKSKEVKAKLRPGAAILAAFVLSNLGFSGV